MQHHKIKDQSSKGTHRALSVILWSLPVVLTGILLVEFFKSRQFLSGEQEQLHRTIHQEHQLKTLKQRLQAGAISQEEFRVLVREIQP